MNTPSRALHLIDIENLCDSAIVTALQVEDALTDYQRVVGIGDNDLASSPRTPPTPPAPTSPPTRCSALDSSPPRRARMPPISH